MQPDPSELRAQCQRIQVTREGERPREPRLKICLESYEESLGWYTAASLSIPLHQLPLLEQALEQMHAVRRAVPSPPQQNNIIPFPGMESRL
jgi:hypothetical protein